MKTAAKDFRIFWDNAYAVHHLVDDPPPLANLLTRLPGRRQSRSAIIFTSTSKISFAGAGRRRRGRQRARTSPPARRAVDPDHRPRQAEPAPPRALLQGRRRHRSAHEEARGDPQAEVRRGHRDPHERELGGKGVATWSEPQGGYFVSLDTPDGCATRVVQMAEAAGVKLTKAGATFPHGKDPRDRNIRLAPSFPSLEQIKQAMELVATCVELVALEQVK